MRRTLPFPRCLRRTPRALPIGLMLLVQVCIGQAAMAARPPAIVDVHMARLAQHCRGSMPATFGQPFRKGDLPAGRRVVVWNGTTPLPTQTDVKARNADGSVRHAVITVDVPCGLSSKQPLILRAVAGSTAAASPSSAVHVSDILASGFDSRLSLHDDSGRHWHLDARDLLKRIAGHNDCRDVAIYCRHWLSGPLAGEWVVGAPPVDDDGRPHSRLMVFFAVRAYGPAPIRTVRVDTTVENDWAYQPDPKNVSYQATLSVAGGKPFRIGPIDHYDKARWHHVLWWGTTHQPVWFAALDGPYLQATPAVPRYQRIDLSSSMLDHVRQSCAPMQHCDVMIHMEATGAQPQIGPLPQWSSAYVVDPHDYRAYRWMLADSDALGAYGVHYRMKDTGNPLSIERHPCATLIRAAEQPRCGVAPHNDDRLPHCSHDCNTPLEAETAHHGAPAYVAYLATGDWYYAQELSLWADWVLFYQNPAYRGYRKGLVHDEQVRGQAWALRTIGDAAYLLPDDAPLKSYFESAVENNIHWYNDHYADNPNANRLGAVANGYAITYPLSGPDSHTATATWQISFFNWAAGNLADMGFAGATRMRNYFSRFQVGSLNSPGFCPVMASAYTLKVRDSRKSPIYTDFGTVYKKTFPHLATLGCDDKALARALQHIKGYDGFPYPPGTMVGYPASDTGFVANYQIGLAAAANSDQPGAKNAWKWFMDRPVRPDYTHAPQFAVIPSH
ncbi:hypothetical protein ACS8Y6_09840 [Salinisphaera sp. RV14]|uniref:hypothetical protein n=1 Tax=Salinisphaera sp. RV14 TaxID=3454140 RepID=UPI003F84D590